MGLKVIVTLSVFCRSYSHEAKSCLCNSFSGPLRKYKPLPISHVSSCYYKYSPTCSACSSCSASLVKSYCISKSQLYGLSHIVAAVNKAFSFGLIHACPCFMLSRFGESVCDLFVVSTSKIIPWSQVNLLFAESHVYAGSCVNVYIIDRIIDRNTPNYSKSNTSQSEWFSPVYSMASSLNRR